MHCLQLTKSTIAGWTKKKEREKCRGETQTPESLQSKRALKQLGKNKFWLNYFM